MVVLAQQLAHYFITIMRVSWMPVSFLAVHILLLFALISFYVLANPYFELDSVITQFKRYVIYQHKQTVSHIIRHEG